MRSLETLDSQMRPTHQPTTICIMRNGELVSQLHGIFEVLFNGLHSIGQKVENKDLITTASDL